MARGFKAADVYAELHLDRDAAQAALRGVPAALGPDADRAGRELGKKVSEGLARAVEAGSARVAKARRAEVEAAKAVTVAELRLSEARQRGSRPASQLLSLENALEKAQYRLSESQKATAVSTAKLSEAQRRLSTEIERVGRVAGPGAERAGTELGGKLSQGIHLSLVRNSPLIAAAIGAGLLAGAPVALAGATALFSGIGVVAAAQAESVQGAWLGTWQGIKAGAISDAGAIEPVLVRVAANVGAAFQRMRPQVADAFSAAAPQVQVFSDGILGLAENALPGLVRAVERGMPVTQGLADFLEKTGTGLTGFFDNMSAHAPAAGEAFSMIGDAFAEILPTLGELLGQGAELATIVLPHITGALSLVTAAAEALGPLLPAIGAGFAAFKVAGLATSLIGGLGSSLSGLVGSMQGTSEASSAMADGLGAAKDEAGDLGEKAGPILGAVLAGALIVLERSEEQAQAWADALREGGDAADEARAAMSDFSVASEQANSGFGGFIANLVGLGAPIANTAMAIDGANEKLREQWEALNPLEQAQSKVAEWSKTLSDRMSDESTSASDLEAAKRRLGYWQAEAARLADEEAKAIRGVTEAMVAQADQSRALVDSQFAYQHAVNGVEDAVAALADAQAHRNDADKDTRTTQEDVERAALAVAEAYSRQAAAARSIAEENLPAEMDDSQRAIIGAKAELDELNRIAEQYELPPELEAHRQKLIAITGEANGATLAQASLAAAVGELGFAVEAIPGDKHVTIQAPTAELQARLKELGFTITEMPDGSIEVTADTAEAQEHLGTLTTDLAEVDRTHVEPTAALDDDGFTRTHDSVARRLADLNAGKPTPRAGLDSSIFAGVHAQVSLKMSELNARRANPWATLNASTSAAEDALNKAARNRVSYVTQYVQQVLSGIPLFGRTGGQVGDLPRKTIRRSGGGKVFGEGGPTDDRVQMMTTGGDGLLVSPTEWIIQALASRGYGDMKMAAVNSGRADIVLPGDPRYRGGITRARGGPARDMATTGTATAAAGHVTVENLTVTFPAGTSFDIRDRREARRFAEWVREEIQRLDREQS